MHKIFINFRSGDQDLAAPIIERWLAEQFGEDLVFYSSKSIRAGDDFPTALLDEARQCEVLLALIGPQWLTITGSDGTPRLRQPDDWVRREIATALAAGRVVVPVLIAGARRLTDADLPSDIATLRTLESVLVRRTDMEADLIHLTDELMRLIPGIPVRSAASQAVRVTLDLGEVTETGSVTGVRIRSGGDPGVDTHVRAQRVAGKVVGYDRGPDRTD